MSRYLAFISIICLTISVTAQDKKEDLLLEEFDLPLTETTAKYLELRHAHFNKTQQEFFIDSGIPFPTGASLKFDAEKNILRVVNQRRAVILCMYILAKIEQQSMFQELNAKEILEAEIKEIKDSKNICCLWPVDKDTKKGEQGAVANAL